MESVTTAVINNLREQALAQELLNQAQAQTRALDSTTIKNKALGIGAIIICAGVALALCIWAWNRHTDQEALTAALNHMEPIKVTLAPGAGTVKLDVGDQKVKLDADGQKVGVEGTVKLDTSTIDVSKFMQPTGAKDANGNVIKTEVTVFYQQPHDKGRVLTGWKYASGDATTPTSKFCYYVVEKPNDPDANDMFDIGKEGQVVMGGLNKVPNGPEAFRKCHW